jgi:hypothetical protein
VRHLPALILGLLVLGPRVADACPPPSSSSTSRYLVPSYALGLAYGVGGAVGDGVRADAIRYSETNGAVKDLMFGAPMRLVSDTAPKRVDCASGACTYLDVTLWTPGFDRVAGGMYSGGVSFPFERERAEGPSIIQLGVAIGFFDNGERRHARDAIVIAAAVPITPWLHARMRVDLNIYGAMPNKVLAGYHKNSPISAGLTADVGDAFLLTADIERYDFVRGGVGWSLGAAARF